MITFNKKKINNYNNIIVLLTCIVFIIIYSSLNSNNRKLISDIFTKDILLVISIITITTISYFNITIGFVLCIIYIIMILPYFMDSYNNLVNGVEGFANNNANGKNNSKKGKRKKKVHVGGPEGDKEIDEVDLIETLKGNGDGISKFMKKVDNYKAHKKREEAYNNLISSNTTTRNKKYDTHTDNGSDNILAETDKINSMDNEKEDFKGQETVKFRKFDPNDEFDNNLLLTKEICDDIKKRITYEYETIPYLKRYISSRLQEIIDLLDLSA
jgi:hypothetical protein